MFGAGEGEFSVPADPVPDCVVPAVPVLIGAPAFPPTGALVPTLPAPDVPADEPVPLVVCASAATGQTVAAPARTPVLTHRHAVRLMTVALLSPESPARR